MSTAGGFGHLQKGHGVAFADLDNDGDQDIFLEVFWPTTGQTQTFRELPVDQLIQIRV